MERLRHGEAESSLVIQVTPEELRELANKLEARSKRSGIGTSIILPISSSVSFLYNVPVRDNWTAVIGSNPEFLTPQ